MHSEKAIANLRAAVDKASPTARLATPITITLDDAKAILGREAQLTDAVVMAAALWFGEVKDERESAYASEALHETATDLVNTSPRLAGAFKGGAR